MEKVEIIAIFSSGMNFIVRVAHHRNIIRLERRAKGIEFDSSPDNEGYSKGSQ